MVQHQRYAQPWLASAGFDMLWIIGPAFWITALVLFFSDTVHSFRQTPEWLWAVLVMGVDVGHVYSTLYRTYFDRAEFRARQRLYLLTPIALLLIGWVVYALGDAAVFWRVLAYAAVFHFLRQQYGFFMLYGRGERDQPVWARRIDMAVIYLATLYPLVYWHTHSKTIAWFAHGDFVHLPLPWLATATGALYALVALVYIGKEWHRWRTRRCINLPKQLLLIGTALSWWAGIITFDNDLAFTAINTVAHGIPYVALVWVYGSNQQAMGLGTWYWRGMGRVFSLRWLPVYSGLLLLIAYFEEGLWDGLVWREHSALFAPFQAMMPASEAWLLVLIPLLTLPQATHYILDAFIWKMRTPGTPWAQILLHRG
ncbi:MAG: hypothetical protein EXR29_08130 [Betaproteobacteria bacterium]|nr:hypothetical protein [Betaproteobacteria bacterium]